MAEVPKIARQDAGGIPLFWCEDTVPFTAGLVFRTGRCDETLAWAGLTHLVEHLALPARRIRGVDFNGMVDDTTTSFWASGPQRGVLELLAETAAALGSLPLDRLEVERQILLTEAAGSDSGPVGLAALLRFGPAGHGLVGYVEYGLRPAEAADVEAWAASRFTAGNAARWMTKAPPAELALELTAGARLAAPPPDPIDYVHVPCVYDVGPPGFAACSLVARRTYDTMAVSRIAEHRLLHRLRYTAGLSLRGPLLVRADDRRARARRPLGGHARGERRAGPGRAARRARGARGRRADRAGAGR